MDEIDLQLVTALEQAGRQSYAELGKIAGLSKTPCWHRVRQLEENGVIRGYHADVDPALLGLHIHAFVRVTATALDPGGFEEVVSRHPAVLQCFSTAGQSDYLLHVLVPGIEQLDALLRTEIPRMPGVQRIEATVCTRTLKHRAPITGCLR